MALQSMLVPNVSPDRLAEPPPLRLELTDAGRSIGWVCGATIGFGGFATAVEAAHAAWVAHRTLAQHIARLGQGRFVPADTEPLTLVERDGTTSVLASGRPIAHVVRHAGESVDPGGPYTFELSVPAEFDELRTRSAACLIYRTLRKSGVRWSMWRRPAPSGTAGSDRPIRTAVRSDSATVAGPMTFPVLGVIALCAVVLMPVLAMAPVNGRLGLDRLAVLSIGALLGAGLVGLLRWRRVRQSGVRAAGDPAMRGGTSSNRRVPRVPRRRVTPRLASVGAMTATVAAATALSLLEPPLSTRASVLLGAAAAGIPLAAYALVTSHRRAAGSAAGSRGVRGPNAGRAGGDASGEPAARSAWQGPHAEPSDTREDDAAPVGAAS